MRLFEAGLMKIVVVVVALSLFGLFLASCKSGPSKEEQLRARVLEYWKLKAMGKYADAYNLEYPTYKKLVTIEKYIANYNAEAKTGVPVIKGIKINDDGTAKVDLKMPVSLKPPFAKKAFEVNVTAADNWIWIDGDWFHVPTQKKKQAKTMNERG